MKNMMCLYKPLCQKFLPASGHDRFGYLGAARPYTGRHSQIIPAEFENRSSETRNAWNALQAEQTYSLNDRQHFEQQQSTRVA